MKTKQYIIKITGSNKDHKEAKQQIEGLFESLNKELPADMEFYTVPMENSNHRANGLYGLERKVLTNVL